MYISPVFSCWVTYFDKYVYIPVLQVGRRSMKLQLKHSYKTILLCGRCIYVGSGNVYSYVSCKIFRENNVIIYTLKRLSPV